MRLSIIIPMYGVEKYINKCLNSCVNQEHVLLGKDYEIICINDGSPDKSADIARRFADDYSGITVINQENKGLSGARNTGIDKAKGDYVWFVDSDDWIEENCLVHILEHIGDIDILCVNYTLVYDDVSKNRQIKYKKAGEMSGIDLYISERHTQAQFYICNRQYLNDHNLRFYQGIYHEDNDFNYRLLYPAKRIRIYDPPVYCFYKRPNSITTQFKPKRIFDLIFILDRMNDFMKDNEINPHFQKAMCFYLGVCFNTIRSLTHKADSNDKTTIRKMINERKYIVWSLIKSPSIKHKAEGFLLIISYGRLLS